jgi:hypothetical protein
LSFAARDRYDHTDDTKPFGRIEVITGVERRRDRPTEKKKLKIVAESLG